jgi:radical SAM protein with 4Fe4S-binding SPASM domain
MKRFYVQWHILDRCNQRCAHCYQLEFGRSRELGWEGLKATADNMLEAMEAWGAKLDIALTGGEPLLKEELFPLLAYLNASKRIGKLSLITNGTLLPPHVDDLKALKKFTEVRISVDGATAAVHDGIRGKGAFSRTAHAIEAVKRAGIPVILMFTVMKRNREEALRLGDLCRETGAEGFILERFVPLGRGLAIRSEVLSGMEFLMLWNRLLDGLGLDASPEELIRYRGIKVLSEGKKRGAYGSECIVGSDGMAVLPDGTLYPCRRLEIPIGNLMSERLTDIWKDSPILKSLQDRSRLKGRCGGCSIEGCIGCRAMTHALTRDYLGEDPHCWVDGPDEDALQ